MNDTTQAFSRLMQTYAALHPDLPGRLLGPADDDGIAAFESESGICLPEPVRALYLQANGCSDGDGMFGGWEWLTLDFVRDHLGELQMMLEADKPGEAEAATLVPLFHASGDYLCIRHSEPGGRLYYVPHEDLELRPVAQSLDAFFAEIVARLASGALEFIQYQTRRGPHFSVRPPNRDYWPPDF